MKNNKKSNEEYMKILRRALVKITDEMLKKVKYDFEPELTIKDLKNILDEKNWQFHCNEFLSEICFNCIPFDNQLKLYAYIDKENEVTEIKLNAE